MLRVLSCATAMLLMAGCNSGPPEPAPAPEAPNYEPTAPEMGDPVEAPTRSTYPGLTQGPAPGVGLAPATFDTGRAFGAIRPARLVLPAGRALDVVADEIVVRMQDHDATVELARQVGAKSMVNQPNSGYVTLQLDQGVDIREALAIASEHPGVADAGPNVLTHGARRRDRLAEPWDGLLWQTAGLLGEEAFDWTSAWALVPRADGIVVAVLDSGVAYADHQDESGQYVRAPDLACTAFLPGPDLINGDDFAGDDHQHGTHITALIASDPDCDSPVQGYAPGVTILPIKVLDSQLRGSEMALVEGIHEAIDRGAQIINMSLSFGPEYFPSPALDAALRRAAEASVIMVAASGNGGERGVSWPAASPHVLAVGSLRYGEDGTSSVATYSQYGAALDVVAAGGSLADDANGDGFGDGLIAQSIAPNDPTTIGYFAGAGTSQAAAAVTGLAALMLSTGTDAAEVPEIIRRTAADPFFGMGGGHGAIQPRIALERALAADHGTPSPVWHVELVGALSVKKATTREACVAVRVVDDGFAPVADVKVRGRWLGADSKHAQCTTDENGLCTFNSVQFTIDRDVGAAAGYVVQALIGPTLIDGREQVIRPVGFYQMPPEQAEAIAEWADARDSGLVARRIENNRDTEALVNCRKLADYTYMVHNLGPANGSGPTLFLFDEEAMKGIDPTFRGGRVPEQEGGPQGSGLGASAWVTFFNPRWSIDFGLRGTGLGASAWVVNRSLNVWSPGARNDFWAVWGTGLGASALTPFPAGYQLYGFGAWSHGLGADELAAVEGAAEEAVEIDPDEPGMVVVEPVAEPEPEPVEDGRRNKRRRR